MWVGALAGPMGGRCPRGSKVLLLHGRPEGGLGFPGNILFSKTIKWFARGARESDFVVRVG